ncbi:MAG TPA: hypothetical protein VFO31_00065 [Vicinamibacterales bacterium]|nr:hypothetical protein [Vicinamibacterales bacterium]
MNYRKIAVVAACVAVAAGALLAVLIILGIAGYGGQAPRTEVTEQRPYADYVGREFRIVGDISATAWNDFPDRAKILSVTLDPPPRTRNRFVSYVIPMKRGQRVRVLKAWRSYTLFEIIRRYVVSVPDASLPTDVEITMRVDSDGVPDSRYYEPIE